MLHLTYMTNQRGETVLPRVEEADIAFVLFEDIIEPTHQQRWERLAHTNPELAFEILKRAKDMAATQNEYDLKKDAIDLTTFVVAALERALKRTGGNWPSVDGDGDAVRQPANG